MLKIAKKVVKAEKPKVTVEVAPEIQEYQGKPMLCLNPNSKWPFSFGVPKAHMIVAAMEEIKEFVAMHPLKPKEEKKPAAAKK